MFIAFCDSQLLALRRSAMCLSRKRLHLAPDGATSLRVICAYKHIAPPEHRLQELLLTFVQSLTRLCNNRCYETFLGKKPQ